ncbi:P1 family peptidase [Anaerovorax odorimutans]|uniref:P1 family peptidase n=1 Tax=Anaerovorax odorimutans TaxID=109327 RepID=A0ABT1RRQ1_9FIRM|nr:P1 family peptidase [Anaerovorax odorimutans]MCQ4637882.1 P1 family peptidase [Anaerovorax odorimutans]
MKKRARELGLEFYGETGRYNAITDVEGVEVGYSTIIKGAPEDYKGMGSAFARTGVTAILPRGRQRSVVYAGRHDLNGNGELTGTHWMDDSGFIHGPIMITNTNSVGIVRDSTTKWMLENKFYHPLVFQGREIEGSGYFYPVVGETYDGLLNDTNGFHVKEEHVREALETAHGGAIAEGNVGGGTGMVCHEFKGGTGTASRKLDEKDGGYTVGVLVQANHGARKWFTIGGVPLGEAITGVDPVYRSIVPKPGTGSIIVVLATDAPVNPIQLSKMCKRVPIGIGRLGSGYENGSGDIFVAFSTANENSFTHTTSSAKILGDFMMDPIYKAVADAVEEAILNALCAAETMEGMDYNKIYAMPQEQVVEILKKHGKIK